MSGRETLDSSASIECLAVASGFLNEHLQNHPSCSPDAMPCPWVTNPIRTDSTNILSLTQWPTRTMDVGLPDGAPESLLSIIDAKKVLSFQDDKTSKPWVALSRCWSGHSLVMTTAGNIHEMEKPTPMSILPPLSRCCSNYSKTGFPPVVDCFSVYSTRLI